MSSFWGVVQVEADQESWTPYQFGFDNPVRFNDSDGLCVPCIIAAGILVLDLVTAALPAHAPSLNQELNKRQLDESKSNYNMSIMGALLPGGEEVNTGWGAVRIARGELQREARNEAAKAAQDVTRTTTTRATTRPARRIGDGPSKGRFGNKVTKDQVKEITEEMKDRGYEIESGGGKAEKLIPGPDGAGKGGSYADITATKGGRTVRVNTVDTKKGKTEVVG